ncbi:hypothetical protein QA640_20845 [Bradyrhizobium sp. CB82]|uniref:hypothetical protein n=1 Tax=Bradyrhizobium sp. CB82 TaxID=3039159 RepID=UPI0024B0DA1D|nr:hypothetical protein [Bradyrhizobium sp. CB82]WFU44680.1 hypothetical protein QA640_20845 [Bradyrhizobium sp. CB82]
MNIEKRALLDHAERCRRVAEDLAHNEASRRLRTMADEYEARAARLEHQEDQLRQHLKQRRAQRGRTAQAEAIGAADRSQ